ncbi:MAG: Sir2 family NAD-dependent protein deacetylase [Henriciella sp.]|nr:Sir2 family NAD-dependent protein deacetylase [Henriciella sp.]
MTEADQLAALLAEAKSTVVFTGAGISTESGIPDFRSPGGVWSKMKPIYFQDFVASRERRREAWTRVFNRTAGWVGADPNAGHYAVAKLYEVGKVTTVITQNVDNLHQESGIPDAGVIEVHGNASYATCLDCGAHYEHDALRPRWEADQDITCDVCGGLVKTATISFGQPMPEAKMLEADQKSRACDLFLVLGSSLVVYPAANLPLVAKQAGAKLVIVNRDPTDQDVVADLVLNTDIGPLMSQTLNRLNLD